MEYMLIVGVLNGRMCHKYVVVMY